MKRLRVQPLGLSEKHRSQKRARSITTDAARHRCLIVAAGLVVFVPTRGRFRVNTIAPIVIRMAITGLMAGINIYLLSRPTVSSFVTLMVRPLATSIMKTNPVGRRRQSYLGRSK